MCGRGCSIVGVGRDSGGTRAGSGGIGEWRSWRVVQFLGSVGEAQRRVPPVAGEFRLR